MHIGKWGVHGLIRIHTIIGERSEPSLGSWTENFVLLCMAICGIYIYIRKCGGTPYIDFISVSRWKHKNAVYISAKNHFSSFVVS